MSRCPSTDSLTHNKTIHRRSWGVAAAGSPPFESHAHHAPAHPLHPLARVCGPRARARARRAQARSLRQHSLPGSPLVVVVLGHACPLPLLHLPAHACAPLPVAHARRGVGAPHRRRTPPPRPAACVRRRCHRLQVENQPRERRLRGAWRVTDGGSVQVLTCGGRATDGPGERVTARRGFGSREVADFGARLDLFRSRQERVWYVF